MRHNVELDEEEQPTSTEDSERKSLSLKEIWELQD